MRRFCCRFEYRHSHLSRDTHLESFIRRREIEAGEGEAVQPRKAGSESALSGKVTRRSMNGLSLFAALRLSENRFSSRGDQGTVDRGEGGRDWQSFNGANEAVPNVGGLLAPLMEDRVKSKSREGDEENDDNVQEHEYGVNVNLNLDPPAVQREYATQAMLDEVCALLNATTVTKFIRIAMVRCAILCMFFLVFLYSDCEEAPGNKLECTWLDLF